MSRPKHPKARRTGKYRPDRSPRNKSFPVVGIGASAGGLEACTGLFRHLPQDTGAAFVLVQHLDPKHESVLPDLLTRVTRLPVLSVRNGMKVQPDHVYVIPPNTNMTVSKGALRLQPRHDEVERYRPIDRFLESLAQDQGHRAVGVILSGTATDGTRGLSAVKAEGGITFAQNESAKFESMPRSAIASGSVDFVLPPEEIAREVARIARNVDFRMPLKPASSKSLTPTVQSADGYADILRILQRSTGVDFTHYKPTTVERRILRRMILSKELGLKNYREYVESTPGEAEALYQDLLIGVTSFFRNPEVFEALKRMFPELLRRRNSDETVRVWVYGCSTGEEAYSIAIAFMEYCRSRDIEVPMQIFATDLNETSIERARAGIYSKAATDVSPERLRRFFTEVDGRYQVNKTIRDMCVFARQNLITDPPFSHMDLVSCRNVLIYLEPAIQRRIVPLFHYALKPHGLLMLGASESVGSSTDLFEPANHKHKIYRKKPASPRFDFTRLPGIGPLTTEQHPPKRRLLKIDAADDGAQVLREADRILLSAYSPAAVLINKEMEILQYRGHVGPYLEPASGKATHNLLKMSRSGLSLPLRKIIQDAIRTGKTAQTAALKYLKDMKTLRVKVIPVRTTTEEPYFLVVFQPARQPSTVESDQTDVAVGAKPQKSDRARGARLEEELTATKEYLQSIIDQQQAYVEELQSSNEEVQSSNEELQTLSEEMETAKEETQATNEELTTLNDEMHSRNKELHQLNDDLINLFQSVRMPIMLVDRDHRLRRFTPAAEKMFRLRDIDIGHPLPDLKLPSDSITLATLLTEAIDKDRFSENELLDSQGCWFSLQVWPYRTTNDKTVGAVVLLKDIDLIRKSEMQVRAARDYAEAIISTIRQPVLVLSQDLHVKTANRAFYQLFGVSPKDTDNQFVYELGNRQWDIPELRRLLQDILLQNSHVTDFEVTHDFPVIGRKTMLLSARRLLEKDAQSQMILLAIEDVTDLKRMRDERAEVARKEKAAFEEVEAASHLKDEFLATVSHELRTPLSAIFGWARLLNQGKLDSKKAARAMETIERNAHAQVKLVDDLMEVARIISGKLALQTQSIDAAAIVAAAIETVRPMAEAKKIELSFERSPIPLPVLADPDRLQQVLWNLLSNAIKFTPASGRVQVRARYSATEVEIAVSDNGKGIRPEFLPRIFQRFAQADSSTTRTHGGLGLGLAIAHQLMELHGGSIEAASEGEGKGSTFTVRLPYRPEIASRLGSARPAPGGSIPKGLRVLIVDDEPEARELLTLIFEQEGAKVKSASSSSEALRLLKTWKPGALVCDIGMPDMDGYQLIRRIRELRSKAGQIPAVAVTAYTGEVDRKRALDAGYNAHIPKPFYGERLIGTVAAFLGRQPAVRKK